jgi:hypothetical protein
MERKRIVCLFLFAVLILVFSACHPRHVSDIKLAMTKEEVVTLWGPTDLITYKTVNGTTLETWEYHFAGSGSICRITFLQDRVTANPQCDRSPVGRWYYSLLERQLYPDPYDYPYPYSYYDRYPYLYYYAYPYYYGGYYSSYRPYYYPYHYPYYRGGFGSRGFRGGGRGGRR